MLAAWEHIPTTSVLENKTSEPRDALLSERTTLSWLRFSLQLVFSSVAVLLNFRIKTDHSEDNGNDDQGFTAGPKFIVTVATMFVTLALLSTLMAGYNYFQTVSHCMSEKIVIFNPNPSLILLSIAVAVLVGVSVTLITDQVRFQ